MSNTVTFTEEFTSTIPATRLFNALVIHGDELVPKLLPEAIKDVQLLDGDGGPGSIKQMNFAEGISFKYLKHRVDVLDKEKLTYSYTMIEGEQLADKIESVSFEVKIEAVPDGGSKGTNISKYTLKSGVIITEEEMKAGKEKTALVFKAVETYLLANPEVYA